MLSNETHEALILVRFVALGDHPRRSYKRTSSEQVMVLSDVLNNTTTVNKRKKTSDESDSHYDLWLELNWHLRPQMPIQLLQFLIEKYTIFRIFQDFSFMYTCTCTVKQALAMSQDALKWTTTTLYSFACKLVFHQRSFLSFLRL